MRECARELTVYKEVDVFDINAEAKKRIIRKINGEAARTLENGNAAIDEYNKLVLQGGLLRDAIAEPDYLIAQVRRGED